MYIALQLKIIRILSYLLLGILLLAQSCKKDEAEPRISSIVCLPTAIVTPEFLFQIYYNNENKVVRFTAEQQPYVYQTEFIFDVNQERIVSAYFMRAAALFSGIASVEGTGSYTYDTEGRLTSMDSTANGTVYRTTYQYNSSDQLITSLQFINSNGTDYLLATTTYEYPNTSTRNPSTVTDSSGAIRTYEYDDKPNPAKILGTPSIVPDNNVTRQTHTLGTLTETYRYDYLYNEQGYPTQKKSETRETQYTYDCKTIFQ